jgi:uncharacterized protein (DUF1501 family)
MTLAVKSSEALSDALNSAYSAIDTAFQGTNGGLADQLYQCAKLVAARAQLGVSRHAFFTSMGGFDTHNAQRGEQASRFRELGPCAGRVPEGDGRARCSGQGNDVLAFGFRQDISHQRQCRH